MLLGTAGDEALLLKKPKTSAPREPPSGRYRRLLRFLQCKVKKKAKSALPSGNGGPVPRPDHGHFAGLQTSL